MTNSRQVSNDKYTFIFSVVTFDEVSAIIQVSFALGIRF